MLLNFIHQGYAVPTVLTERLLIKAIMNNKESEK